MSITSTTKPLDVWVNDLLDVIWFQPDDELAIQTLEKHLSPDIHIDVNGKVLPRAVYLNMVRGYRKANTATNVSNPTLAMVLDDKEKQTGVVAHGPGKFRAVKKETGEESSATIVTITKVEDVDGERVMTSLTEVLTQD